MLTMAKNFGQFLEKNFIFFRISYGKYRFWSSTVCERGLLTKIAFQSAHISSYTLVDQRVGSFCPVLVPDFQIFFGPGPV